MQVLTLYATFVYALHAYYTARRMCKDRAWVWVVGVGGVVVGVVFWNKTQDAVSPSPEMEKHPHRK